MSNISKSLQYFTVYFSLTLLTILAAKGQEELTGLYSNQQLRCEPYRQKQMEVTLPITLPFFDDFSTIQGYPDPHKWTDSTAYINRHISLYSISIGVATLDGADARGELYPLSFGQSHRNADSLSSQSINLADLQLSDSIYLSFFYQSGGLGAKPGTGDSLIVDFYNGTRWKTVWAVDGGIEGENWHCRLIPVQSEEYLIQNFRFRFRNIVSPSGGGVIATNCDMWNIDYVRLDKNRHSNDTIVRDVAYIRPPNSVLKQYSSIPWRHYILGSGSERGNIDFYFANHDNIDNQNITTYYRIVRQGSSYIDSALIGAMNYPAFAQVEYSEPVTHNLFPLVSADSVDYLVETKLITSANYPKSNDVATRLHRFSNYYAYDDGSAENGYNLNQAGNMAAVKYQTAIGDSLRGVYIYFNTTRDTLYQTNYFDLCVWADDGGMPGEMIYTQGGFAPSFGNNHQFKKFLFDSAVFVSGYFFVGWRKTTDRIMSVGIDKNTQTTQRNFYNLGQQWVPSAYNYAVMIRPIISRNIVTSMPPVTDEIKQFITFPVPANDMLTISYPDNKRPWQVSITDMVGRLNYQSYRPEVIDVTKFDAGVYIITFIEGRERYIQKIIISR